MSGALSQDPKLTLIVRLCRELAKLGVNVGLSDARPAAVIRPRVRGPLWVTVDESHQFYEWLEADKRYPASSPTHAATSIAKAINASNNLGAEEKP